MSICLYVNLNTIEALFLFTHTHQLVLTGAMQIIVMLVKGDYVMTSVHTCLLMVQHTASDTILKTAVFIWATGIQMTVCLVGVGVTDALFSAFLISPEGLVAVVIVAVVSAATLGQEDTVVAVQDKPWVTLAGLHTSQCAGP